MAYGIQIKNGSSETIIDESNPVLVKASSGTSTYTQQNTNDIYLHEFNVGQDDMLFVEINDGDIIAFSADNGDNISRKSVLTTRTSLGYFFAKDSNLVGASSSGYGMEIRDGSGGLVYSSNQELIPANGYTGSGTYTLNSGVAYISMPFVAFSGIVSRGFPNGSVFLFSGVERIGNQISPKCFGGAITYAPIGFSTNGCTFTAKYTVIQR
jgi:hypothetical protein